MMIDWRIQAKRILKSELVRRGISNQTLADMLTEQGCRETSASVASKISRGTFSAAFFLHSLHAIGCNRLDVTAVEANKEAIPHA